MEDITMMSSGGNYVFRTEAGEVLGVVPAIVGRHILDSNKALTAKVAEFEAIDTSRKDRAESEARKDQS